MTYLKKSLFIIIGLVSLCVSAQIDAIKNKINLAELIVEGNKNDEARLLIKEVIKKQAENSPKSLKEYQFSSYTKFLLTKHYNDIPNYPLKNKEDSSHYNSYKETLRNHEGLLEKGTTYAYKNGKGEKVRTDAVRISGIETPLLEIAAIDPLPYEFNQNEFKFFYFRSFINPLSNKGLQHYIYQIQDTISLNGRSTIEVSFKNAKKDENPLYGSLFIDEKDKALAEFFAEYENESNQTSSGGVQITFSKAEEKKYYLTSKYKKINNAWFPKSQEYHRVAKIKYHTDSTQSPHKKYYYSTNISAKVHYFNQEDKLSLDEKALKGFTQEISKKAFTNFQEIIPAYRTDSLTQQEKETYVVLDSIGRKENFNEFIKYGRFFLNGFYLPLGNIDFYVPSLYSYNAYEGVRLGAEFKTNRNFHSNLSFQARLNYGFNDKEWKYMLGTNYLFNKAKNSIIGVKYSDDVEAFARPVSPLRTKLNYFRESNINTNNENYFSNEKFEFYTETTFFENLEFLSSLSLNNEYSLSNYSFENFSKNKSYKQYGLNLNLRFSPNNRYIIMPYGKLTTRSNSPNFYLIGDYSTPINEDGYTSLRFQISAEHSFSWFNKTAHILIRGGKVFGDAPLWKNFNQGLRGEGSWFKPWNMGSTNNFETMPAMQFFSDRYIMAQWRQELFNIQKDLPVYSVFKFIYGDFKNKEIHHHLIFDSLEKGYFEGGIEVRKILFNSFGLGAYYRFGEYQTSIFKENFALKFTLDLPFGKINF